MKKIKVLVLCTGNSCRSQIMHGFLKEMGKGFLEVYSAGVETHGLNPNAVSVMKEAGIDISSHTSNHIDEYRTIDFDYVITVCDNARETCPYFPSNAQLLHHSFNDPAKATGKDEEIMGAFRKVREEIKDYSKNFVWQIINEPIESIVQTLGLQVNAVYVENLNESLYFYVHVLGFRIKEEMPPGYLLEAGEGEQAFLLYLEGAYPKSGHEPLTRACHCMCLKVESLEEAHRKFKNNAIRVLSYDKYSDDFGLLRIADPDGNLIEFAGKPLEAA